MWKGIKNPIVFICLASLILSFISLLSTFGGVVTSAG